MGDTTEESGLLMLNPKQKLKPHLGTDTVDITAGTDTLTDTDTDTTEENDLLMPNLQLMPKLSHGTMLDTTDTHTLMGDTDTHMLITTLERDLLMLNQQLKVSHGMDMGTVDMVMDIILTAMDTVVITMDKPTNLNS